MVDAAQLARVMAPGKTLTILQREGIEWLAPRPRSIYADDMGLGKTIVCLVLIALDANKVVREPGKPHPFRALVGVRSRDQAEVWMKEAKKLIAPDFFSMHYLDKNDEALPRSDKPTLVFSTYRRVLLSFQHSARQLPPGVAEIPKRTLTRLTNKQRQQAGFGGLAGAVINAHGGKRKEPPPVSVDDELEELKRDVSARMLAHSYVRLDARKEAFANRAYWTGDRIDPDMLMPRAPLRPGHPEEPLYGTVWDALVFDEAHELRSADSATWKAALFLVVKGVMLWTTGTVMQNSLSDAVAALVFLREPTLVKELGIVPPSAERPRGCTEQEFRALQALASFTFRRSTDELIRTRPEVLASDSRLAYLVNNTAHEGVVAKFFATPEEQAVHDKYIAYLKTVAEQLLHKRGSAAAAKLARDHSRAKLEVAQQRRNNANEDGGEETDDEDDEEEDEYDDEGKIRAKVRRLKKLPISSNNSTRQFGSSDLLAAYGKAMQACLAACVITGDDTIDPKNPIFSIRSGKMLEMLRIIREKAPRKEQKVVVFHHLVEVLKVAARALCAEHIVAVVFSGETAPKLRTELVDRWRNPESGIKVLLVQTLAGGMCHTWTEAKLGIHLGPNFNPGPIAQANKRIWRMGQTEDVEIYMLITAGSVEELVYKNMTDKHTVNTIVMDETEAGRTDNPQKVRLNPLHVLEGIASITCGRDRMMFKERDTIAEKVAVAKQRALYESPAWATEIAFRENRPAYIDVGRCYSEASFLPRGSVVLRVCSAMHYKRVELSHLSYRNRFKYESSGASIAITTAPQSAAKRKKASSLMPSGGIARQFSILDYRRQPNTPTPATSAPVERDSSKPEHIQVALCAPSLYSLFDKEVFEELRNWSDRYWEQRKKEVRVTNTGHVARHDMDFFPANAPPVTDRREKHSPDSLGQAYSSMQKLLGNSRVALTGTGYDLTLLNAPAEISSAMRDFFPPYFSLFHITHAPLTRGKDLVDEYNYRQHPNGKVEIVGTTAVTFTDNLPSFRLDVDVLLAFSPAWIHTGFCSASRLLTAPPNSGAERWVDSTRFRHVSNIPAESLLLGACTFSVSSMKHILMPLLFEAVSSHAPAMVRTMATAVLCLYALSGATNRLYLIAAAEAGRIKGIALAVRPSKSALLGVMILTRSAADQATQTVLRNALFRDQLFMDKEITHLYGAGVAVRPHESGFKEQERGDASVAPRVANGVDSISWSYYATGYANYVR